MIRPVIIGGNIMKQVAIYIRVSTSKQDTDNQRRELEAVAARSGWQIVKVFEDAGISGAKGRDQRPGLDAMLRAVNAKEFNMVAAWSVDRLGRSLTDYAGQSCKPCTTRASTSSCISKDWTLRLPAAKLCTKCWAFLVSLSGASSENGSTLGLQGLGQTAPSWAGLP